MGCSPSKDDATGEYHLIGDQSIMCKKEHGTSHTPVQDPLNWGVDAKLADNMCNFNRRLDEKEAYYLSRPLFMAEIARHRKAGEPMSFCDSNTGKILFRAPKHRSWDSFLGMSNRNGWLTFTENEVNWKLVRALRDRSAPEAELVSIDGTHLGRCRRVENEPLIKYWVSLHCIAGHPAVSEKSEK
jgi:hypothetical protein